MEFRIETIANAQAVPRVLEHFALRDLTPTWLSAERDGEIIHVVIRQAGLEAGLAAIIAEKLRAGVLIASVALCSIPMDEA